MAFKKYNGCLWLEWVHYTLIDFPYVYKEVAHWDGMLKGLEMELQQKSESVIKKCASIPFEWVDVDPE